MTSSPVSRSGYPVVLSLYPIAAEFPMTPLGSVEVYSLICLRRVGAMDTARIVVNLRPDDVNPYVTAGSPLRIVWEGDNAEDEFIGYVHSFRPVSDGYSQRVVVIAISAAYPMFNESGRTFYRVGIHNVAEEIGDDNRFQVETDPHPLMQEQVLQGDASDWGLLKRLADEWGYVLMMDGVTLIFRPLKDVLQENYRTALRERTQTMVAQGRGSGLIEFKPSFSAASKVPITMTTGQGVQPVTTKSIYWDQGESTGIFQEQAATRSIVSELEGELVSTSQEARRRFPFSAKAIMQTPAGRKPLDVYQIEHEGRRMTWAIQSVKHIVTGSNYLGEMVLGSDGEDYVGAQALGRTDISVLLRRNRRAIRPEPVIIDTRPYYVGTGANAVVKDQRWKALVMRTPVDDRGEEAA
jgi:hypothetical protein